MWCGYSHINRRDGGKGREQDAQALLGSYFVH
jgi:hypothetical protein